MLKRRGENLHQLAESDHKTAERFHQILAQMSDAHGGFIELFNARLAKFHRLRQAIDQLHRRNVTLQDWFEEMEAQILLPLRFANASDEELLEQWKRQQESEQDAADNHHSIQELLDHCVEVLFDDQDGEFLNGSLKEEIRKISERVNSRWERLNQELKKRKEK